MGRSSGRTLYIRADLLCSGSLSVAYARRAEGLFVFMATDLENLQTRRSNILTRLAALGFGDAGDKPDASGSAGGISHVAYKDGLYRELETIERLITSIANTESIGVPFEVTSQAEV